MIKRHAYICVSGSTCSNDEWYQVTIFDRWKNL